MSAVDWVLLAGETVKVGDLVSAEAGGMPIYRVVAVADGQAWLQGEREPAPSVKALDGFRWKGSAHPDS